MNNIIMKDAYDAVNILNKEIKNSDFDDDGWYFPCLTLNTDGESIVIEFLDCFRLWFSDEDNREFYDHMNDYQPLETYLRKEAQEIINKISKIKLFRAD